MGLMVVNLTVPFICIMKSLLGSFRVNGESRFFINMLLLTLLFTTFIFSLGTGNYGTSNRHWDVSWWILCLLFVYTREKL